MFQRLMLAVFIVISPGMHAQEPGLIPKIEDELVKVQELRHKAEVFSEEVKINLQKKGEIIGLKELPMRRLFFVEAEHGSYVVSADGRFVFDGRLVDVWHRKTIKNLVDATKIQRTPVKNIGFKPEEQLATFQFGDPNLPRSGVAFVDPTSDYTTTFLKYVQAHHNEYNWTVILAPLVGGATSMDRARRLWCATDSKKAKNDLVKGTHTSFDDLKKDCPEDPLQMVSLMASVFNIEELPHIIREDGLVSSGFPVNFEAWYQQP